MPAPLSEPDPRPARDDGFSVARVVGRARVTTAAGLVALLAVTVVADQLSISPLWLMPYAIALVMLLWVTLRRGLRHAEVELGQLDTARRSAQDEAVAKAQFLANMSHEIRTPMNGVLGMAELLVQTRLDADQQQMASTIQSSADSLLGVLNDILDFSKIEAGKLVLEQVDFDVWQLVDECAGLMHRNADEKGVEMMSFVDPRVRRCHRGDSARLRQVLTNLLSNAVKFTLEGEVVLGVDLVEADDDSAFETLRFWIRDTGIGIAPAAIESLFLPFMQADTSTTRRFGGTGLGLVICRRLVEAMGGELGVESAVDEGSTFSFELQLPIGDPQHARKRSDEVDLTGHSVLIVDDNETNRMLMMMQLAPTNVGMDVASNAISAVEMLRKAAQVGHPFTMAIIDMAMPGIDGMQLAEAIRNDPEIPELMVSLASSLGTQPSLAQLAEADVFRWLGKPLSSTRLLQAVHEMASRRSVVPSDVEKPSLSVTEPEPDLGLDVLVAEDNEINRRVIMGMLRRLGCKATFAVDGKEALQLATQREFAMVLMDCQMPEMDGFEATRAIRELGGDHADLPILALTANVMPADREACLAAGMDDFLPKPIKLDLLRSAVQRWGRKRVCEVFAEPVG